jgi:hypothetical protein
VLQETELFIASGSLGKENAILTCGHDPQPMGVRSILVDPMPQVWVQEFVDNGENHAK